MAGRYIVRTFKNGVKHVYDTVAKSCIHIDKVKERIPKKEFDILYEDFKNKQHKKAATAEQLPKISDILCEVVNVYSDKISIEEIIGALELSKSHALTMHKQKIN